MSDKSNGKNKKKTPSKKKNVEKQTEKPAATTTTPPAATMDISSTNEKKKTNGTTIAGGAAVAPSAPLSTGAVEAPAADSTDETKKKKRKARTTIPNEYSHLQKLAHAYQKEQGLYAEVAHSATHEIAKVKKNKIITDQNKRKYSQEKDAYKSLNDDLCVVIKSMAKEAASEERNEEKMYKGIKSIINETEIVKSLDFFHEWKVAGSWDGESVKTFRQVVLENIRKVMNKFQELNDDKKDKIKAKQNAAAAATATGVATSNPTTGSKSMDSDDKKEEKIDHSRWATRCGLYLNTSALKKWWKSVYQQCSLGLPGVLCLAAVAEVFVRHHLKLAYMYADFCKQPARRNEATLIREHHIQFVVMNHDNINPQLGVLQRFPVAGWKVAPPGDKFFKTKAQERDRILLEKTKAQSAKDKEARKLKRAKNKKVAAVSSATAGAGGTKSKTGKARTVSAKKKKGVDKQKPATKKVRVAKKSKQANNNNKKKDEAEPATNSDSASTTSEMNTDAQVPVVAL